jgi:hypothetical protein
VKKNALRALKQSIKKWEGHAAATSINHFYPGSIGPENCPLCKLFIERGNGCEACPVGVAGHRCCEGTPHAKVCGAVQTGNLKLAVKHSQMEVEFLRSLLPEGEA